jgi:hypothetical protein
MIAAAARYGGMSDPIIIGRKTAACLAAKFSNGCSRYLQQPSGIASTAFRFCPVADIRDQCQAVDQAIGIGGSSRDQSHRMT